MKGTCRICCYGAGHLIAPCLCEGEFKWVHRGCLDKGRVRDSRTSTFDQCPKCNFKYEFVRKMSDGDYMMAMCRLVALVVAKSLCVMAAVALVLYYLGKDEIDTHFTTYVVMVVLCSILVIAYSALISRDSDGQVQCRERASRGYDLCTCGWCVPDDGGVGNPLFWLGPVPGFLFLSKLVGAGNMAWIIPLGVVALTFLALRNRFNGVWRERFVNEFVVANKS